MALKNTTTVRGALALSPAMVGFACGVAATAGGLWVVVVGALTAIALTLIHVWPTPAVEARLAAMLGAKGGRADFGSNR